MPKSEQHRALETLEKALREGALEPDLREKLVQLAGKRVRPELAGVFDAENAPATKEELCKKLKLQEQHQRAIRTLFHYNLAGPMEGLRELLDQGQDFFYSNHLTNVPNWLESRGVPPMPTSEKVLGSFSRDELETALDFDQPRLIVIPKTGTAAMMQAMANKLPGFARRFGNSGFYLKDAERNISGWRASIIEGCLNCPPKSDDDVAQPLEKRIQTRKGNRKTGEKGMDRYKYAMLFMDLLYNGSVMDRRCGTILDDDNLANNNIPVVRFVEGDELTELSWWEMDGKHNGKGYGFRSSVGGDANL